ncbi:unnamed protein product [Ectocarpus sp. CCAP 1310/34]|nr:unnamed protein product [Ectocarpus sp. CCAP 1310/34]
MGLDSPSRDDRTLLAAAHPPRGVRMVVELGRH